MRKRARARCENNAVKARRYCPHRHYMFSAKEVELCLIKNAKQHGSVRISNLFLNERMMTEDGVKRTRYKRRAYTWTHKVTDGDW